MTNNILYISDGSGGTPGQGNLAPLVQGQYGQDYLIEIRIPSGGVADLTGFSTITGHKIKNNSVTALAGSLTLSGDPDAAPQVTWVIDEDDTGDYGRYTLLLTLSDGTDTLKTLPAVLEIVQDKAVNDTPAAGLVGVTTAERALLTDMLDLGYPGVTTTTQSGTSYTFDLDDANTIVQSTNGSATTFTVPPNSSVAYVVGTVIGFEQYGAGVLTIAAGSGVTIRNPHAGLDVSAQYGGGALRKIATNEWMITGMLE